MSLPTKYSEQTKSVGLGSTHWRILEEVVSKGGVIVQNIVFIVNRKNLYYKPGKNVPFPMEFHPNDGLPGHYKIKYYFTIWTL